MWPLPWSGLDVAVNVDVDVDVSVGVAVAVAVKVSGGDEHVEGRQLPEGQSRCW